MFPRPLTEWLFDGSEAAAGSSAPTVTTPPQPHPDLSKPPAAAPSPASAPQAVAVPIQEFERLRSVESDLATLKAAIEAQLREAKERETQALVAKGQAEEAVKRIKTDHESDVNRYKTDMAGVEARAKRYALDAELASALAGIPFVSKAAADQFRAIVAPQLQVHPDGETFAVRTATYQTASDVVKSAMASADYAHFFAPATRGGTPAAGSAPAPTSSPSSGHAPASLDEEVLSRWQKANPANPLLPGLIRPR